MKSYQHFFYQYHSMYRPFINKLNACLAEYQLYSSQWAVLRLIVQEGPLTLGEIATHQNVEKPTVTRMAQRLKEFDYIEVIPGKDKREKRIQLTKTGKKIYTDVQLTIEQFQKEALQGISEEKQLEISQILATVQENLLKRV